MSDIEYTKDFAVENIMKINFFDLTDMKYHGSTTFSSGVLPKWDLLDRTFMIKRCGIDEYGRYLTDSLNEELVYKFCVGMGINCAYYRGVQIKYFDAESRQVIECPAVLTKIFSGELTHYRALRDLYKFGSINDQIIDFTDRFHVEPELNDLMFVDYIFNQQDRHSKNFGVVNGKMSPIFDSGSCLFCATADDLLADSLINAVPRHKTFGKRLDDLLAFCLKYINNDFSFEFDEIKVSKIVDDALSDVTGYQTSRLSFIRKLLKERVKNVGQILAEV